MSLNYLKQLNSFHKLAREKNLSPADRGLYLAILDFNNSLGWQEQFGTTDRNLMSLAGFKSCDSFYKSKKKLIELELVSVEPSARRGRASIWKVSVL